MKLNRTGIPLDRAANNEINENWDMLEGNARKMENDFNNFKESVTDEVVEQLVDSAKLNWKEPVGTYNDLPANPEVGETRMVRDTGKVYRFDGKQWVEIQEYDATAINEVDSRLTAQLSQTMSQTEFDSWVATLLDGGPSIFFDTLIALQTAYPNGAAGVALIRETDPAKIYVWNPSENRWQDYGAYQGIEVKDGTVTERKTTFIEVSSNLFDKNNVVIGQTLNSSGNLIPDSNFATSGFIDFEAMATYTFKKSVGWTGRVAYYDVNFNLINTFPLATETEVRTSTTPPGTRYVRISCRIEDLNIFQINKGSVALPYEKYYNRLSRKIELQDEVVNKENLSLDLQAFINDWNSVMTGENEPWEV